MIVGCTRPCPRSLEGCVDDRRREFGFQSAGRTQGRARRIGDVAVRIAGGNPDELDRAGDHKPLSADRTRYEVLGLSVVVTAALVVFSVTVAINIVLGRFTSWSLVYAAVWGAYSFSMLTVGSCRLLTTSPTPRLRDCKICWLQIPQFRRIDEYPVWIKPIWKDTKRVA